MPSTYPKLNLCRFMVHTGYNSCFSCYNSNCIALVAPKKWGQKKNHMYRKQTY